MKIRLLTSAILCSLAAGLPAAAHTQELPLSGPAYLITEQAYSAYARGDYAEAIRQAREAIRLRPDLPRLRALLRQAETAARPRTATTHATSRPGLSPSPSAGTANPTLAGAAAQRALAAVERNAWREALTQINQAVLQAPAMSSYRLVQIDALIQLGDFKGAQSAVDAALAIAGQDVMPLIFSAYLQQRDGHENIAAEQYLQALQGNAPAEAARNIRLIAADAALAANDNRTALQMLEPLADNDVQARERRQYAGEDERPASALALAIPRLRLAAPALQCRVERAAMTCMLLPASSPSQAIAAAAYQAAGENHVQEALDLFDQALRIGGPNPELTGRRDAMRGLLARAPAAAAYQALADNDPEAAQAAIAQALAYVPDAMSYHLVRIDALTRLKRYGEAEAAATAAMAVDDEDVVPLVQRAYLRQMQHNYPAAHADYVLALKSDVLSDDDLRNLRLYVADATLAAGDISFSTDTLKPLAADDAEASWRRTLIAASNRQKRPELQAPFLDCRLTPYGTVCTVRPADNASQSLAQAVMHADAKKDRTTAIRLARALVAAAPANENDQRLLAQMLNENGNSDEAARILAGLHGGAPDLEFAYLAMVGRSPVLATQAFKDIDAAGKLPARSLQDAGFAALDANERRTAGAYFRRAIDAAAAGELPLTPQQLFETRRAVSEMDRQWGYYVAANYRGSNMQAGLGNTPAAIGDNLQIGTEAYWRPEKYNRNGTYIDLYGRVTGTAYGADTTVADSQTGQNSSFATPAGLATVNGAVGIRWKPLSKITLVAAFERQFPIGTKAASGDWLARLGYSYGYGSDLRVDVRSWNTVQLFAEAGHYLQSNASYVTSEAQLGRSFRVQKNTVLTPHIVAAADYNNLYPEPSAVGAGLGINLRQWLREDRYHAPQSYIDLSLQYRRKLAGDDRAGGWFIRSIFNY